MKRSKRTSPRVRHGPGGRGRATCSRKRFYDSFTSASSERSGPGPARIPVELRSAFDDARYWIEHEIYPPDTIAVRLHHRLVAIHPFPNGNGRTTRLMADLVAARLGQDPFTWGRRNLTDVSETRQRYVAALRAADNHDIEPLLEFARS
jgi:Fic-DOC domain mobile mystery protein B